MQKKKGISLIVLVITIIVMIVLAGAIILSLNNAGIIEKSNEAVKSTDEATAKEIAQMAWAEAYADGVRHVEDEGTTKGFRTRVKETLKSNGIDTTEESKYLINVTDKGVTIKLKDEAWIQEGSIVRHGDDVLSVGQTVKYESGVEGYTGGWKVLGSDADGNLLIMSSSDVKTTHKLGYESTDTTIEQKMDECRKDWLNGAAELDSVCTAYGKGKGAINARSIRVEDINAVTKYVPEMGTYGKGTIYEYGNVVTYLYNKTTTPSYKGTNNVSGILNKDHNKNGFYWYDGNSLKHASVDELKAEDNNGKTIATLTNNYYYYAGTTYLDSTSEVYKMLFGTAGNYNLYWLANPCIITDIAGAYFAMRAVGEGNVGYSVMFTSFGSASNDIGVRAVITLSSELDFEWDETSQMWIY